MPPNQHALLSASGAHRWLECPPSAKLNAAAGDTSSDAAAQGTAAHGLAEWKLRRALHDDPGFRPRSTWQDAEMEEATDEYVDVVLNLVAAARQGGCEPLVLIEQRLDFSHLVPGGFGTADALVIAENTVHVVDFKYGLGVLVSAEHNPQLMLYALGALHLFDTLYDVEQVELTIVQPRRAHLSTWTIPVAQLNTWAADTLKPAAAIAATGGGDFRAGSWCQFCTIAATCRARAQANLDLTHSEFAPPAELSPDEITDVLARSGELARWAKDVADWALAQALRGQRFDGFKLVAGRSIRRYADEQAVADAAQKAGFSNIFEHKLLGVSALEKLMGKQQFAHVLGNLVVKPDGKPTLVPISDKRPELLVDSAANDFNPDNTCQTTERTNHV